MASAVATLLAARFAPSLVWYVAIGGPFLITYAIVDAAEWGSWAIFVLPLLYLAAMSKTFKELSPDDVNR